MATRRIGLPRGLRNESGQGQAGFGVATARAWKVVDTTLERAEAAHREFAAAAEQLMAAIEITRGAEMVPEPGFADRVEKLGDTTKGLLNAAHRARDDLAHHTGLQEGMFAKWLTMDPVGATLYVTHCLRLAARDVPEDWKESGQGRSLTAAAEGVSRLAERFAAATGEPMDSAAAVIADWWSSGAGVAPTGPTSRFESGLEEVSPGRARTREWLEGVPWVQLSVLANALDHAGEAERE